MSQGFHIKVSHAPVTLTPQFGDVPGFSPIVGTPTWSNDSPSIGTLSPAGDGLTATFTPNAAGTATIRATHTQVVDIDNVTIEAIVAIAVTPNAGIGVDMSVA